jgi:hypothetical protein
MKNKIQKGREYPALKMGHLLSLSTFSSCLLIITGSTVAIAQSTGPGLPGPSNTPPPIVIHDTPPPVHTTIPLPLPVQPHAPFTPILPTDLTQPIESPKADLPAENPNVLSGLQELAEDKFPGLDGAKNPDGIIVAYKQGSDFSRPGNCSVDLVSGEILVSVRRPSRLAQITSKIADASFSSDADVEVRLHDGALRFMNLSGLNQKVLVKVPAGVIGDKSRVFAIRPGYELVVGDHKLTRPELRPSDGYARRFHKTLENGQMAISEISVESILRNSDLIADLKQKDSGSKERRILADMSKMAAVLNHLNGNSGFEAETKASLQVNSQIKTKN